MSQDIAHLSAQLAALSDRNAVYEVVLDIASGVDRYDPALLADAIWADAHIDMGGAAPMTGAAFAAALKPPRAPSKGRMHVIGNHRIRVDGDRAECESYVISCQETAAQDGDETRLRAGRYLDRFERRDGTWKLSRRVFVDEWSRLDTVKTRPAVGGHRGAPSEADLSRSELPLLSAAR